MKSFILFSVLCALSASAYSAQSSDKDKTKRPGFIEKRQNTAREIMRDNFNTPDQSDKKKKLNFGFHKAKKEKTQKL